MIQLESLCIRAGEFVLPDVSFEVQDGEYAVIMGRTGIGKTTILEAIAGLRKVERGVIRIGGADVTNWTPGNRNVGYVPQDLCLFPTLNVEQQICFAMKIRFFSRRACERKAKELAVLLGIENLLNRGIDGLSGGEAQRVALGRALSFGPSALLLDEPLSALDTETRSSLQTLLKEINRKTGVSVLHVTHNQEEAGALADTCIRLQLDEDTNSVVLRKD
ncbi:MAG: ATP-binding cassette domain-containing protein [Pirellulaceae bacterium]